MSDGGKPFASDHTPTESGLMVLPEMIQIVMEQVRSLQFDRLALHHLTGGPLPMWFSIDSTIGEAQPGDAKLASSVGTNLKKLSEAELTVLTRHAGALLDARIAKHAPALLGH